MSKQCRGSWQNHDLHEAEKPADSHTTSDSVWAVCKRCGYGIFITREQYEATR